MKLNLRDDDSDDDDAGMFNCIIMMVLSSSLSFHDGMLATPLVSSISLDLFLHDDCVS